MDFVEQTFDIRLFDDDKDPLNEATDMLRMINKMGEDGKKHERKQGGLEGTLGDGKWKPLLPKFLANILIVVCSVLSTMATIIVILVLVKYCKMSSIVASLVVGFTTTPNCASYLTTALAGGEYLQYMPGISHWILIFRHVKNLCLSTTYIMTLV